MALAAELRKLLPFSLFSKTPRCSHLASLYTTRLGPRPTPGRFSYSMAGWVHHARQEPIPDEKSSHYNKRRPAAADTDNFNSREPQPPRTTMEDTDDHHFQARGKRWDRPPYLSVEAIRGARRPWRSTTTALIYRNRSRKPSAFREFLILARSAECFSRFPIKTSADVGEPAETYPTY